MTRTVFLPSAPGRRAVLTMIGAAAVPLLAPQPLLARGGDGGGGRSGAKTGASSATGAGAAGGPRLTQRDFTRLSKRELIRLYHSYQVKGETVVINGFSEPMSSHLVNMGAFRHRRTQGLVRDMQKLKGPARQKRLQQEQRRVAKELRDLKAAYAKAKASKQRAVMQETLQQIDRTREYGRAVDVWAKHPHEGTR